MKEFSFLFFIASLILFTNCTQENIGSVNVEPDDLIGNWETLDQDIQFLIGNHYCNSFELRENNDFAIYYSNQDRPSLTRIDGTWSIEDGQKIVFRFPRLAVSVSINRLTDSQIEIVDEGIVVVLNKN